MFAVDLISNTLVDSYWSLNFFARRLNRRLFIYGKGLDV